MTMPSFSQSRLPTTERVIDLQYSTQKKMLGDDHEGVTPVRLDGSPQISASEL